MARFVGTFYKIPKERNLFSLGKLPNLIRSLFYTGRKVNTIRYEIALPINHSSYGFLTSFLLNSLASSLLFFYMPKKVKTLEIEYDHNFQKKVWIGQRIGWFLLLVFLTVSFLGFTGSGPLNSVEASNEAIQLSYKKYARRLTPVDLNIAVTKSQTTSETISLWISKNSLTNYQIQSINPEPDTISVDDDKIVYEFKIHPASLTLDVNFELEPESAGKFIWILGSNDGTQLSFDQIVYP